MPGSPRRCGGALQVYLASGLSFTFNVLPGVLSQSIPLFLYGLSRVRSSVISASVLGVMLFLAWRPAEFLFWGELGHARNKV